MWPIVRRAILPALLLIGSLASLIYGALFNFVPVVQETESDITIEVPAELATDQPPPPPDEQTPDEQPSDQPPSMVKQTVKKIDQVTIVESEPKLMLELTVGGIALISGELKRTYSGDKPPAPCPS